MTENAKTAAELDAERAALIKQANVLIADVEEGRADEATADATINAMLTAAETLRKQADELRVTERTEAERAEADELAAKIMADQSQRVDDNKPSLVAQIRNAIGPNGGAITLNLDLANVARFRTAVASGVTASDIAQAQRSGSPMAMRDLAIGTDSAGGVLVPEILENVIYDSMRTITGVRAAGAEVMATMGGGDYEIPRVAAPFIPSGVLEGAEATEVTDTDDTYDSVTLSAHKYTAQNKLSRELLQDHATDLNSLIGRRLGEIVATKMEMRFTSGTGTNMPKGIADRVPAGKTQTSAYTSGSTTSLAYEDLTGALGQFDPKYLQRPITWMMNSDTYWRLQGVTDTQGQPVFAPRTEMRPYDTLLGHRISYNNFMDTYAASKTLAIVGDFNSAYVIRDVGMYELAASSDVRFLEQQVVFQGTMRADGIVRDVEAFRAIKTGS